MLFALPPFPLRSRLAPTPSGLLHPGNGLSFVMTWALVRATGGHLLLRIDDLDKTRCRDEYIEDIFETLDWLGLDYDEGPTGVADFHRHWSQHRRLDAYHLALDALRTGGHLFACSCSRRDVLAAAAPDGRYPGTCAALGLPFDAPEVAWRVRTQPAPPTLRMSDMGSTGPVEAPYAGDAFVVRQRNAMPAYQLGSLVDDTLFGINFVVRGQDLWDATWAQLYLAHLLGNAAFARTQFWHHPLILGTDGHKLSKSKGAGSLRAWRQAGQSPAALFEQASAIWQLPHPARTVQALKTQLQAHTVAK